MATSDRATVVGIFTDDVQTQQAIQALRQAGFSDDQITYSGHGTSSGGFLAVPVRPQPGGITHNRVWDDHHSRTKTTADVADTDEARRLKLRAEQLQVFKQPVQTGEVGIRKEVVSEQQTINVPVTHEEVYIERRAGSGQVSDMPIGEGETLRVPVSAEQVQVNKQTVETGEVALGKRAVQETQQVSDTVRREEARVERRGDVNVNGDDPGVQDQ